MKPRLSFLHPAFWADSLTNGQEHARLFHGKDHGHTGSPANLAGNLYGPAVQFGDAPHDGEAQAHAPVLGGSGVVCTIKAVEDVGQMGGGDAAPRIDYFNPGR